MHLETNDIKSTDPSLSIGGNTLSKFISRSISIHAGVKMLSFCLLVSKIGSDWAAKTAILQRSAKRVINKYINKLNESVKYLYDRIINSARSLFSFPFQRADVIFELQQFLENSNVLSSSHEYENV